MNKLLVTLLAMLVFTSVASFGATYTFTVTNDNLKPHGAILNVTANAPKEGKIAPQQNIKLAPQESTTFLLSESGKGTLNGGINIFGTESEENTHVACRFHYDLQDNKATLSFNQIGNREVCMVTGGSNPLLCKIGPSQTNCVIHVK